MDLPFQYSYKTSDGQEMTSSPQDIARFAQEKGYQVHGVSPDGTSLTMSDPGDPEQYQLDVKDLLSAFGNQVTGAKPTAPDENFVHAGWRAAIHSLPDDDAKKAYLESVLKREGFEEPKVIGQGRDFYAYDPQSNQWKALTNSSKWGLPDIAEGALDLARGVASGAGAVAGAGVGMGAGPIGAVAGGAAGGGIGSGVEQGLEKGIAAAVSPEYRQAATLGEQAQDVGKDAVLDAALGGVFSGVPAGLLARSTLRGAEESGASKAARALLQNGPVSATAKSAGAGLEATGTLAKKGAELASGELPRALITGAAPVTGPVSGAGWLMRLPQMAIEGGANALGHLSKSQFAQNVLGQERASQLAGFAEDILKPSEGNLAQKAGSYLRVAPEQPAATAADILKNIGAKADAASAAKKAAAEEAQMMDMFGMPAQEAAPAASTNYASAGGKLGEFVKNLGETGKVIEQGAEIPIRAGLAGIRGVGAAAQATGGALKNAAEITGPLEYPMLLRKLAQKQMALRQGQNQSRIPNDLTQNNGLGSEELAYASPYRP